MSLIKIEFNDDELFDQVQAYVDARGKDVSVSLQELLRAGLCMVEQGKIASSIPKVYDSLPEFIKPNVALGMFTQLSQGMNALRKENERLETRLNSFLQIFGKRAQSLMKTWDVLEAKQEEYRRQVKEGKVKVWSTGDPEDKVVVMGSEIPSQETKEEYEERKVENKKWGIETE